MSFLSLSILNTRWRARALMGLVLVFTRADPIPEWLEKKHKGEYKARPTLGIAAITALTGCWIQVCDSSKDDMENWFSCSNMFKQESLMAINWWETIFEWMNVSEWGTGKKNSSKFEKNESEKDRFFCRNWKAFCRRRAPILQNCCWSVEEA